MQEKLQNDQKHVLIDFQSSLLFFWFFSFFCDPTIVGVIVLIVVV